MEMDSLKKQVLFLKKRLKNYKDQDKSIQVINQIAECG